VPAEPHLCKERERTREREREKERKKERKKKEKEGKKWTEHLETENAMEI